MQLIRLSDIDNFTLFHFKFPEDATDEHLWTNMTNSSEMNVWRGIAFERVCLEHVPQIKRALGVSGVHTETSSWSCLPDPDKGVHGSQIDLLISKRDHVINLCEMKYASDEYALTRASEESLRRKVDDLLRATGTRSSVHVTLDHRGHVCRLVCSHLHHAVPPVRPGILFIAALSHRAGARRRKQPSL